MDKQQALIKEINKSKEGSSGDMHYSTSGHIASDI